MFLGYKQGQTRRTLFLVSFLAFLSCKFKGVRSNTNGKALGCYLGVTQKFQNSTLVRREAGNLPDNRPNEGGFGGCFAFSVRRLGCFLDGGRGMALVHSVT